MRTTSAFYLLVCLAAGAVTVLSAGVVADTRVRTNIFAADHGGGLAIMPGPPRAAQGAAASDGWYTTAQAERGKVVYEESCTSCHGASLRGGANEFAAPPLAGPFFYEKWNGKTVEELFQYAADNMPPEEAKLSEAAYLDVTAYILQVLKYPAGRADLTLAAPAMKRKLEQPKQ